MNCQYRKLFFIFVVNKLTVSSTNHKFTNKCIAYIELFISNLMVNLIKSLYETSLKFNTSINFIFVWDIKNHYINDINCTFYIK